MQINSLGLIWGSSILVQIHFIAHKNSLQWTAMTTAAAVVVFTGGDVLIKSNKNDTASNKRLLQQ